MQSGNPTAGSALSKSLDGMVVPEADVIREAIYRWCDQHNYPRGARTKGLAEFSEKSAPHEHNRLSLRWLQQVIGHSRKPVHLWRVKKLAELLGVSAPELVHGQTNVDEVNCSEAESFKSSYRAGEEHTHSGGTGGGSESDPGNCILTRILRNKVIKFAALHYPPLCEVVNVGEGKRAAGLYGMILEKVAAKHELKLECEACSVREGIALVSAGRVDFVLSIFQTTERSKHVDFAACTHSVAVGGLMRAVDRTVSGISDLRRPDVNVAVVRGEIGYEFLLGMHIKVEQEARIRKLDSPNVMEIYDLVKNRRVHVGLSDCVTIANYLRGPSNSGSKLVSFPKHDKRPLLWCSNGIMVKRGQEKLIDWITEETMAVLSSDHQVRKFERWVLRQYPNFIRKL